MIGYRKFNAPAGQWYQKTFADVTKKIVCDDLDIGRGFAEAGLGVTLLPTHIENKLHEVYRLPAEFGAELWILTHKDMRNSARIKTFWDFLINKLTADELVRKTVERTP